MYQSKILIVEDDLINIEIFTEILHHNYQLFIAPDGKRAEEILTSNMPDIILLDVMLPDTTGIELCRKIKANQATMHIPIIMATSLDNQSDKIRGLEAGANDYLIKPVDSDELKLKIKNHLEIKHLRDELLESYLNIENINKELKKNIIKKGEILSIVAHDMRNPLTTIGGLTEMLMDEFSPKDPNYSYLQTIERSSDHLISLINDMLEKSKIEAGDIDANKKEVDPGLLAEWVVDMNIPDAHVKQQKIDFSNQAKGTVNGDKMMLRSVMDNLVSNAIKYSPYNATISITLQNSPEEDAIEFIVIDEGPGFKQNEMGKLFGRFQRLSAKPTGGESSTGLGLSIVKDYTERHNGSIHVENEPERGARITVSFPMLP